MTKRKVVLSLNPCKLKGDRGNRSSRLGMFATLFTLVWAPVFAFCKFLAICGLVIGAGTVFGGVLLGVGGLVLMGWFLVNLFSDGTNWGDREYRRWRRNGGDPYFDWTWFWPLNTDSDDVRRSGGYVVCPHPGCGQEFSPARSNICPSCGFDQMDFLRCGNCGTSIYDPNREYDQQSGIQCPGCQWISRNPSLSHLPVIHPALPPVMPSHGGST